MGQSDRAMYFDGYGDETLDSISNSNTKGISGISNGTVSFWVRPFGRASYPGNNQEGKIQVSNSRPLVYGIGSITIHWPGASSEYIAGFSLPDNVWSYVTIVCENAGSGSSNGVIYSYHNSILKNTVTDLELPVGTSEYYRIGH